MLEGRGRRKDESWKKDGKPNSCNLRVNEKPVRTQVDFSDSRILSRAAVHHCKTSLLKQGNVRACLVQQNSTEETERVDGLIERSSALTRSAQERGKSVFTGRSRKETVSVGIYIWRRNIQRLRRLREKRRNQTLKEALGRWNTSKLVLGTSRSTGSRSRGSAGSRRGMDTGVGRMLLALAQDILDAIVGLADAVEALGQLIEFL